MGNNAAILGVGLLLAGIMLFATFGNGRAFAWARLVGVMLAVAGLGVEVVGAVTA